ncbi:MAG: GntR family transcriptional regulator, partial [Candidatus Eisenbacteria bacterium]|nr:GntR family transcriptional regulator [Candidatus Latescibacterota bacterium]MBD3301368.1 GntR family transcriptional regulator [Candidatus Eisenbacteria bacterium]
MERLEDQLALDGIHLDRTRPEPLYAQLAEAIRAAIRADRLAGGQKLPATRDLAERLRVNRTTVVAAYRILREEELVESGIGAGTFVRRDGPGPERRHAGAEASFWASRMSEMPRPEPHRLSPTADGTILFT